ncbi:MAG: Cys-tRNA(Pro) deacylase [Myxococcota bacterium]
MTKTNAARLLDTLGVAYEIRTYEVDESDLSAPTVARKVGLPYEQVWKTLVVRGDGTVYLAVVPADAELDLKALAVAAGERKVELAALKDVLPLTGYIRGGVTVLGCRKEYPVFVDDTIDLIDRMAVSAGMRGAQLVLNPQDYLRVTKATVARIAR